MSTSQSTIDFLLDQLSGCEPVTARKMFGEYCLYVAGRPVGLVCDNQLFLKNTAAARGLMQEVVEAAPYPKARPHLLVTADQWDDRHSLCLLLRATAQALREAELAAPVVAKKPRAKSAGRASGAAASLAALPNLGPKSQQMLEKAGIRSLAQLKKLGAVAAYSKVKHSGGSASLNLLWALEGALTDLPWQVVAREHRTSLLLALEQHEQGAGLGPTRSQGKPARAKGS